MGYRVALQAIETELSPKILLRRECQCYQDPSLGDFDSQSVIDGDETPIGSFLEFLRSFYNGENNFNVLRQLL